MEHHTDTGDLVIKLMPSEKHESAHITLADEIQEKDIQWGIPRENRLKGLGGTTFSGRGSSKEADTTFRPISRPIGGWPTIVFESGLSEGLARLRADARWWLMNSGGDVNIILIISVKPAQMRLLIESLPGHKVAFYNCKPKPQCASPDENAGGFYHPKPG